jgi:hypothetical protein
MNNTASIFSANEPTLGYLYQIRYGLMLIVAERNEEAKLLIEKLDDISIDTINSLDVYQTKLHINSIANLTNASTDLWKTIRVWSEGIKNGTLNPETCIFNLVTTAIAPDGTIPSKLKQGTMRTRNVEEIINALLEVTKTSSSTSNSNAYNSFCSLTKEQQELLVEKIIIIDASLNLNEAKSNILHEVRNVTLKTEALYERLEGWFIGQVILQLQNQRNEITVREVRAKIIDVADCLKADNLPNDFNIPITTDEEQLKPYRHLTFVKQLEIIDSNQRLINHAISDYHRAFSQKSKWLREGLISPLDETEYHNKIKEDWDRKFAIIADSTSSDNEETQKHKGKAFYETHYVNQCPQIHIKERFKEQYMTTGCCQMLSDKKEIGWHPDFENKI